MVEKLKADLPTLILVALLSSGGSFAGNLLGDNDVRGAVEETVKSAVAPIALGLASLQSDMVDMQRDLTGMKVDVAVLKAHDEDRSAKERGEYRRWSDDRKTVGADK